jgi:hypothetical protein
MQNFPLHLVLTIFWLVHYSQTSPCEANKITLHYH